MTSVNEEHRKITIITRLQRQYQPYGYCEIADDIGRLC